MKSFKFLSQSKEDSRELARLLKPEENLSVAQLLRLDASLRPQQLARLEVSSEPPLLLTCRYLLNIALLSTVCHLK